MLAEAGQPLSPPARRPEEGAEPRPLGPSASVSRASLLPARMRFEVGTWLGLAEAGAPLSPWKGRSWLRFFPELGRSGGGGGGAGDRPGRTTKVHFSRVYSLLTLALGGHVSLRSPGLQLPGARQPKPGNQIWGAQLGRGGRAGRWARANLAPALGCAHILSLTMALQLRWETQPNSRVLGSHSRS